MGPIRAELDNQNRTNAWITISLNEGRNREIRKVMGHLGLEVNRLIRIAFGPFQLGNLPRGQTDEISGKVLREQLSENSLFLRKSKSGSVINSNRGPNK